MLSPLHVEKLQSQTVQVFHITAAGFLSVHQQECVGSFIWEQDTSSQWWASHMCGWDRYEVAVCHMRSCLSHLSCCSPWSASWPESLHSKGCALFFFLYACLPVSMTNAAILKGRILSDSSSDGALCQLPKTFPPWQLWMSELLFHMQCRNLTFPLQLVGTSRNSRAYFSWRKH